MTIIGSASKQAGVSSAGIYVARVVFKLDRNVAECLAGPERTAVDVSFLWELDLAIFRRVPLSPETTPLQSVSKIQGFPLKFSEIHKQGQD